MRAYVPFVGLCVCLFVWIYLCVCLYCMQRGYLNVCVCVCVWKDYSLCMCVSECRYWRLIICVCLWICLRLSVCTCVCEGGCVIGRRVLIWFDPDDWDTSVFRQFGKGWGRNVLSRKNFPGPLHVRHLCCCCCCCCYCCYCCYESFKKYVTLLWGGVQQCVTHTFFTFSNTVFKPFGSEKFCLRARLGFKRYFLLLHLAFQCKFGLKSVIKNGKYLNERTLSTILADRVLIETRTFDADNKITVNGICSSKLLRLNWSVCIF